MSFSEKKVFREKTIDVCALDNNDVTENISFLT